MAAPVLCACGAFVPDSDGPTHRYLGALPGCWALFGEVLAREYSDVCYASAHRLTVDAYAVQHPGDPSPQTIRSLAFHLISLMLVLEHDVPPSEATRAMQALARDTSRLHWLTPPANPGSVTVLAVHAAQTPTEHVRAVRLWAESAWRAWAAHHETVRGWAPGAY